jgi:hypothetical protein
VKVAGGGPSVHACAVFFRAKSRDGDKLGQTPGFSFRGRCAFRPPRVVFVLGLVCLMNSLSLLAKILKIPLDTQYAERVLLCLYEFSRILCLHTALHATHDSCVRYV